MDESIDVIYIGLEEHLPMVRAGLGDALTVRATPPERESFLSIGATARAILDASMKLPLRGEILGAMPRLEAVVTATTGADHIDAVYLADRGIPLLTLKGQTEVLRQVNAAAEHSWLLLMACARRLRAAIDHVSSGGWERSLFPGLMLKGKTLGLIGCGRNGQWMARYARAFGMEVLGHDPHIEVFPPVIQKASLEQVLAGSDFISLHVPLNDETKNLIGEPQLAAMRRGVILVNTSRGGIIDETALVAALESGQVGAVGSDVLASEPDIEQSPLWRRAKTDQNCVITPHIGGFSPDALAVVLEFSGRRIRELFQK